MYYFPQYKVPVTDSDQGRFTQDKYIKLAPLLHCKDLKMCSALGFPFHIEYTVEQFSK